MKVSHQIAWRVAFDNAHLVVSVRIYPRGKAWVELEGSDERAPCGPCEVYRPELPEKLAWINSELEKAGWVPMSPWWQKQIARHYFGNWIARERLLNPKLQRRNAVWRVGRRGGKSTSFCRVAVYETLYGNHTVPQGDTGVYAIISAEKPQAIERIQTCKKICDVLGVDCKPYAQSLEFFAERKAIRCFTASLTAVVSFTCIGALCDEQALWRDDDTGANPAKEILASLRPCTATMPNAVLHHVSAPWSTLDEHHKAYERGTQPDQVVFPVAATWEANPTITEQETHLLEPDESSWLRAYAAVPLSSDETKFFNASLIDHARRMVCNLESSRVVCGGDFAFVRDSSSLVFMGETTACYRVEDERAWTPGAEPLRPGKVFNEATKAIEDRGAESLCCDTHYFASVLEHTEGMDLDVLPFPTQPDAISQVYVRLRVLLGQNRIALGNASDALIDELKETTAQPTAGGVLSIKHKRRGHSHGDRARALISGLYALELSGGQPFASNAPMTTNPRRMARSGRYPDSPGNRPGYMQDLPPRR